MNESNQDRIDRFLRREMSSKESLYFEQEALNNPELRQEIEMTYRIKRRLGDRKNKLHTTAQWEHRRRNNIIKLSSISSIAAAVVVGFFIWRNTPEQNTTGLSLLASNEPTTVEVQSVAKARLSSVKHSVDEGRTEEAIKTINNMEEKHEILSVNEVIDRQQLMLSKDDVSKSDIITVDSYECHWIKINSLIKLGQYSEAIECLEKFVLIDSKYKVQADSLLINLKQR